MPNLLRELVKMLDFLGGLIFSFSKRGKCYMYTYLCPPSLLILFTYVGSVNIVSSKHNKIIFVETVFCSFLRQQNFWKIYSINIYGRVSNFLIYDQKKVILNGKHSDCQIFLKTQRLGLQVVANNSTR